MHASVEVSRLPVGHGVLELAEALNDGLLVHALLQVEVRLTHRHHLLLQLFAGHAWEEARLFLLFGVLWSDGYGHAVTLAGPVKVDGLVRVYVLDVVA